MTVPPMMFLAESVNPEPWWNLLINGGIASAVIGWFMWRDGKDREERRQKELDQERRHAENIVAQKRIEDAFRTTTDSLIVGLSSIKNLDAGYSELLARLKGNASKDNPP